MYGTHAGDGTTKDWLPRVVYLSWRFSQLNSEMTIELASVPPSASHLSVIFRWLCRTITIFVCVYKFYKQKTKGYYGDAKYKRVLGSLRTLRQATDSVGKRECCLKWNRHTRGTCPKKSGKDRERDEHERSDLIWLTAKVQLNTLRSGSTSIFVQWTTIVPRMWDKSIECDRRLVGCARGVTRLSVSPQEMLYFELTNRFTWHYPLSPSSLQMYITFSMSSWWW